MNNTKLIYNETNIPLRRVYNYNKLPVSLDRQGYFKLELHEPDEEIVGKEFPFELYYGKIVDILDIGANNFHQFIVRLENREIVVISGILNYYKKEELLETYQIVCTNTKPSNFRGIKPEGAFVFANEKNGNPQLFKQLQFQNVNSLRIGLGQDTIYNLKQIPYKNLFDLYIGPDGYFKYDGNALEFAGQKFELL